MSITTARPGSPRGVSGVVVAGAGAAMALWGGLIGAQRLGDNSFLTHLATGRLLVEDGLPRADPYSFTARGEPWVVQSWLVSLVYGAADAASGLLGVRLVLVTATAVLAWLVWTLTGSSSSVAVRLGSSCLALAVGTLSWNERPQLFAMILLAVTLLVVDDRLDRRWLLLIGWVWVNVHGSFPLVLVVPAVAWLGTRLDRRDGQVEREAVVAAGAGLSLGVINPYGIDLLAFPIRLLVRQDVLATIVEWGSPDFQRLELRLVLLQLVVAIGLLVRRPTYRSAALLTVFTAAMLLSARNAPVLSIVLIPGMAAAAGEWGPLRAADERRRSWIGAAAIGVCGLLVLPPMLARPHAVLDPYPVEAVDWLDQHGLVGAVDAPRLVSHDYVGNYLEARYGTDAWVFIDDRYDLYPDWLVEDYQTLLHGRPGWDEVLARHDAQVVLWEPDRPLSELLALSTTWQVTAEIDGWLIACRVEIDICR